MQRFGRRSPLRIAGEMFGLLADAGELSSVHR